MKLVFGNIKGGVGKSLLACNAAVSLSLAKKDRGGSILLIDGDLQASATKFTDIRAEQLDGEIGYDCVSMTGTSIRTQMPSLDKKYDDIVIDCGGQNNPSLRAALTVADRLVIPVPPRSVDEWALEDMVEMVQEVTQLINPDLKSFLLINMADAQGTDNDATRQAVKLDYLTAPTDPVALEGWTDPGITVMDEVLVKRKPFADGFGTGMSILEHRPRDKKAIDEFVAFMAVVYKKNSRMIEDGYPTESKIARIA